MESTFPPNVTESGDWDDNYDDGADDDASDESWANRTKTMLIVAYPIILIIGTVGNVLSIIVLSKRLSDASAFPLLFMALTISDMLLLYLSVLPTWIGEQFNKWMTDQSEGACKFLLWIEYSLVSLSAWFLAAMTAHRAMTIVWPTQMRRMRPRLHAMVTIVILTASSFVFNSFVLDGVTTTDPSHMGFCVWEATFKADISPVLHWLEVIANSILPSTIMIVCNCLMICVVKQSTERFRRGQRKDMLHQVTMTLIVVSFTFILLTLPFYTLQIAMSFDTAPYGTSNYFWYNFTSMLLVTNSAINFFLYVLTGSSFRDELKHLFRRQPVRSIVSTTSSSLRATARV